MMVPFRFNRQCSLQFIRSISSTRVKINKNHYDVLGITPKATQADIKKSYYKLSKEYHPDLARSADVEKFREVTEAYEVLGNVKLRRLYDKGVHHISSTNAPRAPSYDFEDDPSTKFYKSREIRHKPPTPSGRTTYYDFDEWSRSHYGATFNRDMSRKKDMNMRAALSKSDKNDMKIENVIYCLCVLFGLVIYMTKDLESYDRPSYKKSDGNELPSQLKR